jgi:hypothetical protein
MDDRLKCAEYFDTVDVLTRTLARINAVWFADGLVQALRANPELAADVKGLQRWFLAAAARSESNVRQEIANEAKEVQRQIQKTFEAYSGPTN